MKSGLAELRRRRSCSKCHCFQRRGLRPRVDLRSSAPTGHNGRATGPRWVPRPPNHKQKRSHLPEPPFTYLHNVSVDSQAAEPHLEHGTVYRPKRVSVVLPTVQNRLTESPAAIRRSFCLSSKKVHQSRVPGSGVRGRGSGERETTASSLAGKEESSKKEDNGGQGKDGPAGAVAQGGNGR